VSKLAKSLRFHLERLEDRRLMARDTGAGLDGPPIDEPTYEPPINEAPEHVAPIRNFRPNSPFTTLPYFEPAPPTPTNDITAKFLGGDIFLSETPGFEGSDNGVLITQLPNGVIRITGISANGGAPSTINGAEYVDYAWSGIPWESSIPGLFVTFGDGNDRVEFSGIADVANFRDVIIGVGEHGAGAGTDNDVVSIGNMHARGILMVDTGTGADRVSINNGTHVEGRVHLWTYTYHVPDVAAAGVTDDVIRFKGLVRFDEFLEVNLGAGDDDLYVNLGPVDGTSHLIVGKWMKVQAGAGDDDIFMTMANVGGGSLTDGLEILAGAGEDTFVSNESWFGNLSIKTWDTLAESDHDIVQLTATYIAGNASVDMGGGDDDFITGDPTDDAANFGAWIAGSLMVTTGAGDDTVRMEGSDLASYDGRAADLSIYTGAGADVINLDFRSLPTPYDVSTTPQVAGGLVIRTFDQFEESDRDEVYIRMANVANGLSIGLGGGDDIFEVLGGNYGWVAIDAQDGLDVGYLSVSFIHQQARIDMGAGDDQLTLGFVRKPSILTLSGGDGVDSLQTTEAILADQVFEYGWEWINGFPMWQPLS
jgi:hypothetical protein